MCLHLLIYTRIWFASSELDKGLDVCAVVKFIELPDALKEAPLVVQKRTTRDKFKIVSLKIEEGIEFTPDLVLKENREHLLT